MELNKYHNRVKNISPETKLFVERQMEILDRIHELLDKKFQGNQRLLAERLNVSEAQVSKMINGVQNFTQKTIAKLEAAFGERIQAIICEENNDYAAHSYIMNSERSIPAFVNSDGKLVINSIISNNIAIQ